MTTPEALDPRLQGVTVVASVSGGKDSAAMSLHLKELGIEHRRVFLDTGWEADETYEYLRGELTRVLGPIEELSGERTMEELVLFKGMFPSKHRRFCTTELKVKPMQDYLHLLMGGGDEAVNVVGIRAEESKTRAMMEEWEQSDGFDCWVWRPILRWTLDEVIAIHKRHGLRPNPLYLKGANRVGCWPCIYARKGEIAMIAKHDPKRIDRLRVLEQRATDAQVARLAKTGESLESRGYAAPAWFQAPLKGRGSCWPIDEIVKWANTSRGGYQNTLVDMPGGDDGCMRWGLCETAGEEQG